ncbi:MAG TPA: sugar phosphate isomerase/epimerase family protein [Planctomycetaceae bacterium]|nr:sugar phosphate isomerase/epimerase family protein [Planctomycetaceae bacterium]
MTSLNRRDWLAASGGLLAAGAFAASSPADVRSEKSPFGYCFNTSTIREQKLDLATEIELIAKAGYHGIEPWMREIEQYQKEGGNLRDLRKKIEDLGLSVESAIGFAKWISDDDEERKQGLEQAKRDMNLLRQIGGKRIAAPPTGATNKPGLDLAKAAERYRALLDLGAEMGIVPQLELWGFSPNLSRLGEVAYVTTEAGHSDACLLLDVYHIYKGGSDFAGLRMINGHAMHVLHINDYPADPPRESIGDRDRVYPGDGIAPLTEILNTLHAAGFRGSLSLELFNPEYWKQDAEAVVKTGLEKIKASVAAAFA